jgi:AraC family transcriptional regulator
MSPWIARPDKPAASACSPRRFSIEEETFWRQDNRVASNSDHSALEIGKWSKWHEGTHELLAPALTTHYTMEVLLSESYVDCFRDDRHVVSRKAGFGATQLAAPGQRIRCRFDRSAEAIHLFIARSAVQAACEDLQQRSCGSSFEIDDPCFTTDPTMGKLVEAMAETGALEDSMFMCYVESLVIAVLARLIGKHGGACSDKSFNAGLVQWRLRRAIDFMEANLGQPITLSDIAIHTGLSRMHFAAQFRLATGSTPHSFLLVRRIERAKRLLCDHRLQIVQVASAVGFNSQAHFTTVFRKVTGHTPGFWRLQHMQISK